MSAGRRILWVVGAGVVCVMAAAECLAVDPNPLENAYWRFEEGTDGAVVPPDADSVLDSKNANHMCPVVILTCGWAAPNARSRGVCGPSTNRTSHAGAYSSSPNGAASPA